MLKTDSIASYTTAGLFAVLVHGVVVALMTINWGDASEGLEEIKPYYIEATVVAENPYTARRNKAKNREQSRRDRKLNRRRLDEANFLEQQKRWEEEQKIREAEPVARKIQPEPVKPIEKAPEKPVVDTEAVRSTFENDIALAVADETNMRKAVTDDEKAMAYVAQIQREIIQNWSRPPSARNGMETLLRVHLVPTGEVVDVKIEQSSGNDAFDRSAVLAVNKSERFVVPSDTLRFERDFRQFTVLFRPDDLRL